MSRTHLHVAPLLRRAGRALARFGSLFATAAVLHAIEPHPLPTVGIRASAPDTAEPTPLTRIAPGRFEVTRTGDTNQALTLFVGYSGTATIEKDYADPGRLFRLAPGQTSLEIIVGPIDDDLLEGDETVIATLLEPPFALLPNYVIDPKHASATVTIHDGNDFPVVKIEATRPIAEESSYPLRRLPLRGEFTISRTGPTKEALSVFVLYSGLATPGVDYPAQPFFVTIPAGADSTTIEIVPAIDDLNEGIETVVATLSHCPPETNPPLGIPCYLNSEFDPVQDHATVFIRDDGITQASLHLTQPRDGAEFAPGQTIHLEANAIDLDGYIGRVEFFDGEQRIGESEIVFIRAPDPGTVITHTFDWTSAETGPHVLSARAVRADGTKITSPPVTITVGRAETSPLLRFVEPARNGLYSTLDEVPIVLRAWASNDVFLTAEIFANSTKIAEASFCCWLCPCAHPFPGQETILQIPVRPPVGVPSRPWQGWQPDHAGILYLTARAVGENGTIVEALPVRILVYDPVLHISVREDGTVGLVIREGSVSPGSYDAEASPNLVEWTRLGEFAPGNVAAFYTDPPAPEPRRRRFYRAVFHPALLP